MEDWYIPPPPKYVQKNNAFSKREKIMVGVIAVLTLAFVSMLSYSIGKQNSTSEVLSTMQNPLLTQPPPPTSLPTPSTAKSDTLIPTKKLNTSPSPTLPSQTKILSSIFTLDGFRSSNATGNESQEIKVGRNNSYVSRGFVSFDISEVPSSAKVLEARLRLYQVKIIGNPFSLLGAIKIDHLTYGDSLDKSDYGMAALSSSFATISNNTKIEWKEADVTASVKNDIANARSMSQFRIHFTTETTGDNADGDFVLFESAENALKTGNTPELVIKYY